MSPPQQIAHYRILSRLGEGGMGIVYRALDTRLDRPVGIAALNHPNIAPIYGVEQAALVMELIEGPTLADRLKSGPFRSMRPPRLPVRFPKRAKAIESSKQQDAPDPDNGITLVAGTMTGVIMGTPGYMAPQQAKGLRVDRTRRHLVLRCGSV